MKTKWIMFIMKIIVQTIYQKKQTMREFRNETHTTQKTMSDGVNTYCWNVMAVINYFHIQGMQLQTTVLQTLLQSYRRGST